MNHARTVAKPSDRPRREVLKLGRKPASAKSAPPPPPPPEPAPIVRLVPSTPRPFPLGRLVRADENVRKINIEEGCDELAASITAHGLLQSLIGYELDGKIEIVGGGRRLKALRIVRDRGIIDDSFEVPVLVRSMDEAVELSLAENLEQKNMSPVDECFAFAKLMERGNTSPAELAKRFGFSERVVRQRLRLADLAPPILQALADRQITIDAAMAYASSQDTALQAEVFERQSKKADHKAHRAADVRHALRLTGIDTADRLYRFVGAERYEAEGGTYEDDLFVEGGRDRVLAKPFLLESMANERVDILAADLVAKRLKADDAWAPMIAGFVKVPDLRVHGWGTDLTIRPPAGFVLVKNDDHQQLWRAVRDNGCKVHVVVGIDEAAELVAVPRYAFVPAGQKGAIEKPTLAARAEARLTPEQEAAAAREIGILRLSRRLAAGSFAGTPLEGRTHWPTSNSDQFFAHVDRGVSGFMLKLYVFVTEAEVAAQRKAAAAEYDAALAKQAAAPAGAVA